MRVMNCAPHPWACHLLTDSLGNSCHPMRKEGEAGSSFPPNCVVDQIPKKCRFLPKARRLRYPSYPSADDCLSAIDHIRYHTVSCSDRVGCGRRVCEGGMWLRSPWALVLARRSEWRRIAIHRASSVAAADCGSKDWPIPVTEVSVWSQNCRLL